MSKTEATKPQQTQPKGLSAPPLFADVPERNAQKLVALLEAKYCLGDKGSLMTSAALDKIQMTPLSAQRLVAYLRYTTFEIEEWIAANTQAEATPRGAAANTPPTDNMDTTTTPKGSLQAAGSPAAESRWQIMSRKRPRQVHCDLIVSSAPIHTDARGIQYVSYFSGPTRVHCLCSLSEWRDKVRSGRIRLANDEMTSTPTNATKP